MPQGNKARFAKVGATDITFTATTEPLALTDEDIGHGWVGKGTITCGK